MSRDYIIAPAPLPMNCSDAEQYMREVESQVLDPFHRSLPIWSREPATALLATLNAFDGMTVVMAMTQSSLGSVGVWQYFHAISEGLPIAIRWLLPRFDTKMQIARVSNEVVEEAGRLLAHAADYAQLEIMHIAFGKGRFVVSADAKERRIRFMRSVQEKSYLHFADLISPNQRMLNRDNPSEPLRFVTTRANRAKVDLADGRINYSSIIDELDERLLTACSELQPPEIIDLLPNDNMGSFLYEDFQRYWKVLRAWGEFAVRIYLRLWQEGVAQSECMPTQILPEKDFIVCMAIVTGLNPHTIQNITDFLTLDITKKRADVFFQPLIKLNGHYAWSALLVTLSRQPRNALKLLCRTKSTQDLGATLNGSRERRMLVRFGVRLQKMGHYSYKINIPLSDGVIQTELDLLAYTSTAPTEVLLVQGKTVIAADEQNEIDAATKEMIVGSKQIEDAERVLRALSNEQKRSLYKFVNWEIVKDYYGLVITPDSEPDGQYDPSKNPAISLVSLENRVGLRKFRSPRILCHTCRDRNWQKHMSSNVESYFTIRIGDVTYELPFDIDPKQLKYDKCGRSAETLPDR